MFDVKLLRNDLAAVQAAMQNRGKQIEELNGFTALDLKRRELLQETEQLKIAATPFLKRWLGVKDPARTPMN